MFRDQLFANQFEFISQPLRRCVLFALLGFAGNSANGCDVLLQEGVWNGFVAKLINEDIQIGHLVIEGHASEEGSYGYNYDLSNLRARAIYRALVEAGVHPDRLSHRGYGEAIPIKSGEDEASLALNRRVEFHIVRQDPAAGSEYDRREV